MRQPLSEIGSSGMQPQPSAPCDLVLLDLGLPGKNGFTLCMEIRRISRVPILFLTGRDSALDELQALNLGGDDYIVKPYNAPLLLAHINALLRRTMNVQEPDMLEAGGLSVHLTRGTASAGGKCMELTRNELRILVHLMRHPGEIVSRADLIDALWDDHIYIDDNTLSVNMTRLRGKLAELGLPDCIKTRRGMGYQFLTRMIRPEANKLP
ncbi:MAG TPA: DNA-binding response regulator [Lachnospiraceae bacterium]|nr:DNA-binding response regulator [Lachnospiraceae bacterium]